MYVSSEGFFAFGSCFPPPCLYGTVVKPALTGRRIVNFIGVERVSSFGSQGTSTWFIARKRAFFPSLRDAVKAARDFRRSACSRDGIEG